MMFYDAYGWFTGDSRDACMRCTATDQYIGLAEKNTSFSYSMMRRISALLGWNRRKLESTEVHDVGWYEYEPVTRKTQVYVFHPDDSSLEKCEPSREIPADAR